MGWELALLSPPYLTQRCQQPPRLRICREPGRTGAPAQGLGWHRALGGLWDGRGRVLGAGWGAAHGRGAA